MEKNNVAELLDPPLTRVACKRTRGLNVSLTQKAIGNLVKETKFFFFFFFKREMLLKNRKRMILDNGHLQYKGMKKICSG